MNFLDERVPERFWEKLTPCPMSGCWLWTASTTLTDYGHLWTGGGIRAGRYAMAHRHIYELLVGPIDKALELDHLCRVTICCNPRHLEPVTHAENIRRAGAMGAARAAMVAKRRARTHCLRGHEFTSENTLRSKKGYRACRECARAFDRRRSGRRRH